MKIPEPLAPRFTGYSWPYVEVERVAASDETRPSISEPYLRREGEQAYLYATNSYVLVRVPVEAEGDTDGYVPAEALRAARKPKGTLALADGKAVIEHAGRRLEIERPKHGEFPNVAQLIPAHRMDFSVVVNIDNLVCASRALGAKAVRLSFTANGDGTHKRLSPIIVEPGVQRGLMDGRIALVMPIDLREGA